MLTKVNEDRMATVRVLVADPFSQIREIIRDILLRGIGVAEVIEAKSGDDALTILHDTPCDVVIADAGMEPTNGIELTEKIRSGEGRIPPRIPVIVMSGRAELGEILAARDAGANEYLAKPLSAKILSLRLHSVIDHPRPFIQAPEFIGPDRRRHMEAGYEGPERRNEDEDSPAAHPAENRPQGADASAHS